MKKKITVTKEEVLAAVASEPLQGGKFVFRNAEGGICGVCAVGGVLRRKLGDGEYLIPWGLSACRSVVTVGDSTIKRELARRNYMGALSLFFEGRYRRRVEFGGVLPATHPLRFELIKFVNKNFPRKLTFTVEA